MIDGNEVKKGFTELLCNDSLLPLDNPLNIGLSHLGAVFVPIKNVLDLIEWGMQLRAVFVLGSRNHNNLLLDLLQLLNLLNHFLLDW